MNRRGMTFEMVAVLILIVAVVLVGIALLINGKDTAEENLEGIQKCSGGLIGALGGNSKNGGGCFKDKACTEGLPDAGGGTINKDGVRADNGFYFQYIGEGWGCGEGAYCCIQMPQSANPLRASDINRAKCISDLKDGEWAVQTGLECKVVGQGYSLAAASNEDITFIYKPKGTDETCQVRMEIPGLPPGWVLESDRCYYARNSDGVVTFTSSPLALMQKAYADDPNGRIDLSYLNTPRSSIPVYLKAGVGSTLTLQEQFSLSTTNPGIYYCSKATSSDPCKNQQFNAVISGQTCKPLQGDQCKPV